MKIEDVVTFLQSELDAIAPSVAFDVRSPNVPKLGSVKDGFPVMVSSGEGDYEAYADICLESPTFTVEMLVPAENMNEAYIVHNALAKRVVGKPLLIGGKICLGGLSTITPEQLALLDTASLGQYNFAINQIFGREVKDLRYWFKMSFYLYLTTGENAGGMATNDNGIIFSNQIKNTISFVDNGVTYSEECRFINDEHAMTAALFDQQGLGSSFQKATEQTIAYANTVTFVVRNNGFSWALFGKYKNRDIKGTVFSLVSKIVLGNGSEVIIDRKSVV